MGYVNVAVNATSEFALERFRISADVVGLKHQFMFDECRTTVTLPTPKSQDPASEHDRIRCDKWKSEGMIPLEYQVNSIEFEIELSDPIEIPEELVQLAPKQFNLLDAHEQKDLDNRVEKAADTLERAFSYWLRVLRWKSGIGYIGEPSISYAGANGAGALRDRASGHRIWLQTQVIHVIGTKAISSMDWSTTQAALAANKKPPVWFEFLFEARMRISNKDLVGAVLTLTVAFEVNLRKVFSAGLEEINIDPVVLQIVDLANLRALLTRVKRMRGWNEEWERACDFSTLHKLMDYRDGVMHMAKVEGLNEAELRTMYAAVEKFAYFTTRVLGLD